MTRDQPRPQVRKKAKNDARLTAVEAQIEALLHRVEALEQSAPPPEEGAPPPSDVGLVDQMRARRGLPYERGGTRGAVMYVGAVSFPSTQYVWQVERPVPGLLQLEPEAIARVLAALGSPQRLQLVRTLVQGEHSSQ